MSLFTQIGSVCSKKKDFIWNASGSLIYALASVVLAFLVIRIIGADEGGIFGFGFSTLGQQMFIVAYFGIRPFHITDMKMEYTYGEYLCARRLTGMLGILLLVGFNALMLFSGRYTQHKAVVLTAAALYKILDGIGDVYESELQRQGRLYKSGQSLAFRTLFSSAVLIVGLYRLRSLLSALIAADAAQIFGIWFFGEREVKRTSADLSADRTAVKKLLSSTVLLFLSVFLDFYIFSSSKYAVDAVMTNSTSGIFNILFMPASFVYLAANFFIRPTLTALAEHYQKGELQAFRKKSIGLLAVVAGLCVLILLGTLLLGRWGLTVFEMMLGSDYQGWLTSEYPVFFMLITGGCIYALVNIWYYILVIIRAQKAIFAGYLITAAAAFVTADRWVQLLGIPGAGYHYLCVMLMMLTLFSVMTHMITKSRFQESKK